MPRNTCNKWKCDEPAADGHGLDSRFCEEHQPNGPYGTGALFL